MNVDGRSAQLVEQEEEAEGGDLNADEAAVGMVKEAAEGKVKKIEIRVKMVSI